MLMRYIRQIPPLIKVAGVLAVLLGITALALATRQLILLQQSYPGIPADNDRMQALSMGIGQLSVACFISVGLYSARIRRAVPGPLPPGAPLPSDSWKLQLVTFLIPAALPVCVIVMALVIPVGSRIFGVTFLVEMLGALVIIACAVWSLVRSVEALSRDVRRLRLRQ